MFLINDLAFNVHCALLEGYLAENPLRIAWGVMIEGTSQPQMQLDWSPVATCESLAITMPGEITEWKGLAPRTVEWRSELDDEGNPFGTLYVFSHQPVHHSTVKLEYVPSTGMSILWNGKSNVYWNDQYWANLDIEIQSVLTFQGIWCGRRSKRESESLLSRFFSVDHFEFRTTEHGVSLLAPISDP